MLNVIKCGSCNDHRVVDGKMVYQTVRMLYIQMLYIFVVTFANVSPTKKIEYLISALASVVS